ncbi:sodium-coupled neutral amino acid transporter 7-like [Ciona intestinalis]
MTENEDTPLLPQEDTCLIQTENGSIQSINGSNENNENVPANKGTGTLGAIFIVVNAAMGAGMLNMPEAFKHAGGVLPGTIMQLTFLVFILGSLMILAYCCHHHQCSTYQEVIEVMCGKGVGVATECCIMLYMFGTSIAMIIIVGDQFDKVMEASVGVDFCHHWYMNRKFTMCAFSTAVILPLCIPKDIGFLRHASIVGVIATIIVMLTVVVKYATHTYTPGTIRHSPKNVSEFFSAVPAIFFAYQCHVSSVPVYASLKKKTATNWLIVILSSILLCAVSYCLTGICGYLTFGDDVESDILQNYKATDFFVIAARISIVIAMLTSYPILQFCGRAAITTLFIKMKLFSTLPRPSIEKLRRYLITFTWFFTSLVLALFIPNIGEAIAVVGGLAGCFILLFPGLCLTVLGANLITESKWKPRLLIVIGVSYSVAGTFLFGEITTEAIMNDISNSVPELSSICYQT